MIRISNFINPKGDNHISSLLAKSRPCPIVECECTIYSICFTIAQNQRGFQGGGGAGEDKIPLQGGGEGVDPQVCVPLGELPELPGQGDGLSPRRRLGADRLGQHVRQGFAREGMALVRAGHS